MNNMLMCDQPVSFDNFKVLASSKSEFHLKIKECLLISLDQYIENKNGTSLPLYLFDFIFVVIQIFYSLMTI